MSGNTEQNVGKPGQVSENNNLKKNIIVLVYLIVIHIFAPTYNH